MNEIVKAPTRRKWTLADLDRLSELGFFGEHEHVELIGGELITMAPKGIRHEGVRARLATWLMRHLPPSADLHIELGWRPGGGRYIEPDILLSGPQPTPALIPAPAVLLVIEVAASSLEYDLGVKADAYATLGVRDYWVVNATTLTTRLHRDPAPDGYRTMLDLAPTDLLVPLLAPELAVRLADLEIGDEGLGEDDA